MRYSSRDGHDEGEHVNRGRDTPIFCPTLEVLDMSTLGDAADVNPVIKFLTHTCLSLCWHAPLRRDHPGYCTAEVRNTGGTYELPCITAETETFVFLWVCRNYSAPAVRHPVLSQSCCSAVDKTCKVRVWQELYYRIDICRVTKGGHIEHL